jgi:chorismate mutase
LAEANSAPSTKLSTSKSYSDLVRAVRGAICLTADDADEMREAVAALINEMLKTNDLKPEDLVSVILTATPDLRSAFPAEGARSSGLGDVPLLCAQELDVVGAMPRVVRVLMHINPDLTNVNHVYLRGAEALRQDLHRD